MGDSSDESNYVTASLHIGSVLKKMHCYDDKFKLKAVFYADKYTGEKAAESLVSTATEFGSGRN
jgi:hypothetical protein